jgi:hypothetical protein
MTDRPILFSGPMVYAILEGRKTQTRRVLKPQPRLGQSAHLYSTSQVDWQVRGKYGTVLSSERLPYTTGDRLWVREAWRTDVTYDWTKPSDLAADSPIIFEADGARNSNWRPAPMADHAGKLRPSMFMPRWASRITLEVTAVKVERLQDIEFQDVISEGCEVRQFWLFGADNAGRKRIAQSVFADLWDSINGSRPGSDWEANPWVAAIEFRRVGP